MKRVQVVLLLAVVGWQAPCQEKSAGAQAAQPKAEMKFVELKHLKGARLERVIQLVDRLTGMRAQIVFDDQLNALAIKGMSEDVASTEELLRRFDVPGPDRRTRQIQLTISIIEATNQPVQDSPLPSILTSAAEQLRTAFGYKGFRLMDTILLQGREGAAVSLSGLLPLTATRSGEKLFYSAKYDNAGYVESEKAVGVNGFRFNLQIPVADGKFGDSGIGTDLTIRADQKLVLGKLSHDHTPGTAVFLVVTAKVD
jgi:type II secretory pathway component GspD/PulD (secretin)